MAETPEITAVPAGIPTAEAVAPRPDPSEASLDGGGEAAVNSDATTLEANGSPTVVGSYGTPAPTAPSPADVDGAAADLPTEQESAEAAPAMFLASYGSATLEAAPAPAGDGAFPTIPAAAPATTPENVPAAEPAAANPETELKEPALAEQPLVDEPANTPAVVAAAIPAPPEPAPSPQPEPPGIATSVVVPPLPAGEAGEGGEWDLLRDKLGTWFDGADLQGRWENLGGPLRAAGLLLAAVVLLRLYSALLETLGELPLLPRLLQLVGLLSVAQFGLTRLVRSSERERILTSWRQRWNDFRGRD
jgi:hypothetical protein